MQTFDQSPGGPGEPLDLTDPGKLKFKQHFLLEKFDGEKVDGDGKMPVETLEGGDGEPTILTDCKTGVQTIIKEATEEIEP